MQPKVPNSPYIDAGADHQLESLAIVAAKRDHELERDLLAAVLSDPAKVSCARGVELASAAHVTQRSFLDDGHGLVFLAAATAAAHPMSVVLRLARRTLEEFGFWEKSKVFGNGITWNTVRLFDLITRFPGPGPVPSLAARLFDLRRRQSEAEESYRRAVDLLTGRSDPRGIAIAPRPKVRFVLSSRPQAKGVA